MWPTTPVSPLSLKDALAFKPRIAAHLVTWFDGKKHLDVGYHSDDPAIVKTQLDYLQKRGADLIMFDWYGSSDPFQQGAVKAVLTGLAARKMQFALCFDAGIVKWRPDKSISPADYMVQQVQFALANYMSSPLYEKLPDGRFLALEFGWEAIAPETMDIAKVTAAFPQVGFLFRNASGWGKPGSAGAFAWTDPGNQLGYQKDFIARAGGHPGQFFFGSLAKGFDDHNRRPGGDPTQSAWGGPARIAPENNGQTWLDHIDLYNAATIKPQYIQLVTVNDHEEGTDLEWGIDGGVSCAGTMSGGVATFTLKGNQAAVDHLEIYVDNRLAASLHDLSKPLSVDLNTVPGLQTGVHTAQAVVVGKPFFRQAVSPILSAKAGYLWL